MPIAQNLNIEISLSRFKILANKCLNAANDVIEHFEVPTKSPIKLLHLLKKEYCYIQAAGGIVEHDSQYLYIKRFGLWDLSKGKIEKDESIKNAALREVEEECGITNLKIVRDLPNTYHIYNFKSKPALKETFWFLMSITGQISNLKPQTEEGITELRFDRKDFLLQDSTESYSSLKFLMHSFVHS